MYTDPTPWDADARPVVQNLAQQKRVSLKTGYLYLVVRAALVFRAVHQRRRSFLVVRAVYQRREFVSRAVYLRRNSVCHGHIHSRVAGPAFSHGFEIV